MGWPHLQPLSPCFTPLEPTCFLPFTPVPPSPLHRSSAAPTAFERGSPGKMALGKRAWSSVQSQSLRPDSGRIVRPTATCQCTKTQCLQKYCSCFQSERFCVNCGCKDCRNLPQYKAERDAAMALRRRGQRDDLPSPVSLPARREGSLSFFFCFSFWSNGQGHLSFDLVRAVATAGRRCFVRQPDLVYLFQVGLFQILLLLLQVRPSVREALSLHQLLQPRGRRTQGGGLCSAAFLSRRGGSRPSPPAVGISGGRSGVEDRREDRWNSLGRGCPRDGGSCGCPEPAVLGTSRSRPGLSQSPWGPRN